MYGDIARLGVALGPGLLVGLQRERFQPGDPHLLPDSLFGALSGLIARHFDAAWPVAAGVIAIAVLFALADYLEQHDHLSDVGQTTTVAARAFISKKSRVPWVFSPRATMRASPTRS